jgi:hypothetical protein
VTGFSRVAGMLVCAAALAMPALARAGVCEAGGLAALPQALTESLTNNLVRVRNGQPVKAKLGEGTRYVVLAYGARWCGPCHVFTREVRPIVSSGEGARFGYAYVFVSQDRNQREMVAYAGEEQMDWLILPPGFAGRRSAVGRLAGRAIPTIVVADLQTGRIICNTEQGRERFGAMRAFLAFRTLVGVN